MAEEVRAFYQTSGEDEKTTEEAVFSLAAFDEDTDGSLNKDEFQLWFQTDGYYDLAYDKYLFRAMDQDGDHSIQKSEYRNILKLWGYADEVIERRATEHFKEYDANKDNAWDFEEFRLWEYSPSSEVELRENFISTDKNGNHVISEEELKINMISIGAQELAKLVDINFKEEDGNGNGSLCFPEFAAAFTLRG